MEVIEYYNEDEEKTELIPKDEFVKSKAWNYPFAFVQEQADMYEDIKSELYHQLLLRAKVNPYIDAIKGSSFYNQLYKEVIEGDKEIEKIFLALYFDHDLIETLFNGAKGLVDHIINYDGKDEFAFNLAMNLIDVSELDIDDETRNRILEGIDILMEKDAEEMKALEKEFPMFPSMDIDYEKRKEENIQEFKNRVEKNKGLK